MSERRRSRTRGRDPIGWSFGVLAAWLVVSGIVGAQTAPRPAAYTPAACVQFPTPDTLGHYLSADDMHPPAPAVNGDDLLALVDRSPRWRLDTSYVPSDLTEAQTLRPMTGPQCGPDGHLCLRHDAAVALRAMGDAMRREGNEPWLDSAYRGYATQCSVFRMWAYREHHGFCNATVSSALPGHSQHQLGTAVDLFSRSWAYSGERFRDGFGCSGGGRWLAEHAWEYGFVLPYPLHPDYRLAGSACEARPEVRNRIDPRTGYKYEPWHLRFVGEGNARRFHEAWRASGPDSASEITLEQWLRREQHESEPIEPSVCDGCNCGACATFHAPVSGRSSTSAGPCGARSLLLDGTGHPIAPNRAPRIVDVSIIADAPGTVMVRVTADVADNTLTQPPIVNALSSVRFETGVGVHAMRVAPDGVVHAYPDLAGAWRIGVRVAGARTVEWMAALVDGAADGVPNGVNARIAAQGGLDEIRLPIVGLSHGAALEVGLSHDGDLLDVRTVRVP